MPVRQDAALASTVVFFVPGLQKNDKNVRFFDSRLKCFHVCCVVFLVAGLGQGMSVVPVIWKGRSARAGFLARIAMTASIRTIGLLQRS